MKKNKNKKEKHKPNKKYNNKLIKNVNENYTHEEKMQKWGTQEKYISLDGTALLWTSSTYAQHTSKPYPSN